MKRKLISVAWETAVTVATPGSQMGRSQTWVLFEGNLT
jgi:hypothetical protein